MPARVRASSVRAPAVDVVDAADHQRPLAGAPVVELRAGDRGPRAAGHRGAQEVVVARSGCVRSGIEGGTEVVRRDTDLEPLGTPARWTLSGSLPR